MDRMIFANLPVSDLQKATDFYLGLGFTLNPDFSSDDGSCIVISDTIFVMLLKQDFFSGFLADGSTPHLGSNAKEVLNCLTASSAEEVDDLVAKAQASGGSVYLPAKESMPGMYGASIADPDGHVWELLWMSQDAVAEHEHQEARAAQA